MIGLNSEKPFFLSAEILGNEMVLGVFRYIYGLGPKLKGGFHGNSEVRIPWKLKSENNHKAIYNAYIGKFANDVIEILLADLCALSLSCLCSESLY